MARIKVQNFVTLDGVVQSPLEGDDDLDGGFDRIGWTAPYMDADIGRVMGTATAGAGGFLLGRKTYETFFKNWSGADQSRPPVAALNQRPKYVASRTLSRAEWANSRVLGAGLVDDLRALKERPGPDILVFGSVGLLTTLVAADLVDAYTLLVFPMVLGRGKRMWPDGTAPSDLRLTGAETSSTGVIILSYERR
jgi:dihydrofolate reductase